MIINGHYFDITGATIVWLAGVALIGHLRIALHTPRGGTVSKPTSTKGRACGQKRRHQRKEGALSAVARLVRLGAHPDRIEAYQCEHCGGWHIGHTARGRR